MTPVEPETKASDAIDYNELIFTEHGKVEFWDKCKDLSTEQKLDLVDYMNIKWSKPIEAFEYINHYHDSIRKK